MDITGDDLTIAKPAGNYYANYRGRTALQHERDALEQAATWRLVDLIHRFRALAPQSTGRALTSLGLAVGTTRIQEVTPYFGALQAPSGAVWDLAHHPQGRNYQAEHSSFVAIRAELLTLVAHGNTAVREALASDADTRALLNLNDTLDGPKYATNPDADVVLDTVRQNAFPLDTRRNVPPFGGGADGPRLLAAVDASHFATAGGPPSEESFLVARTAYLAAAGADETGRWFRRMCPVAGLKDPGWSAIELEQLEMLTHVYYRLWSDAQREGDTKAATFNDHRHRLAHIMLAIGADDRLLVTMPADGIPASKFSTSYGGHQSSRSLLPQLVAAYGL